MEISCLIWLILSAVCFLFTIALPLILTNVFGTLSIYEELSSDKIDDEVND